MNPEMVRKALVALLRAVEKGKATRPEDRAFRTQYESVGDYGEPTVREVVNQSPTKAGAIEKAMEGPAGNDPWGTFPADPDSAAIRAARGEANYVQGSDPLGNLDPHGSPRWQTKQSKIGDRISPLAKDPSRLPDNSLGEQVPSMRGIEAEEAGIKQAEVDAYKELDEPGYVPGDELPSASDPLDLLGQGFSQRKLVEQFEALIGRSPTKEELADPQLMQKIVDDAFFELY